MSLARRQVCTTRSDGSRFLNATVDKKRSGDAKTPLHSRLCKTRKTNYVAAITSVYAWYLEAETEGQNAA